MGLHKPPPFAAKPLENFLFSIDFSSIRTKLEPEENHTTLFHKVFIDLLFEAIY
jgi:hypothetical protein